MGRVKLSVDQQDEDVITDREFEWRAAGFSSVGTFEGGGTYGVLSSGTAQVNRVLPAPSTFNGDDINGMEKNPLGGAPGEPNEKQGVDQQLPRYDATLNLTTPVEVAPNDILVKGKGLSFTPDELRDGMVDTYSSFFVLPSAPAANSYAPSTLGWSGRGTLTPYTADISSVIASLPSYSTTNQPSIPTYQDLIDKLELWSPFSAYDYPKFFFYQYATPNAWQKLDPTNENYGGKLIRLFNEACLALISDGFTTPQKEEIGKLLIGHGLQMLEPVKRQNTFEGVNGGHHQWFHGFCGLAMHAIGDDTSALVNDLGGCWKQVFQVTSAQMAMLVPHTDPTKPYPWRERDIIDVDTPNNKVRINFDIGTGGDPSRTSFNGMDMIRKSDGARLNVTAESATTPTDDPVWLTLTGQPAGGDWQIGDVVTFDLPTGGFSVSAGDYDWAGAGSAEIFQWNPMPGAPYREQNKWSGQVYLLKSLGITGDMDNVYGYVKRANDPANNLPDHDFTNWDGEFSAEHGTTVLP